jgi:hypothetical protein
MLKKISIRGFKSLYNLQDLEIGQVNVFIGANGAGKSNLLEAFGMLGAAAAGRADARNLLERGLRHSIPALYKTALKGAEASFVILKASGDWDEISAEYEVQLNRSPESPVDAWGYEKERLWQKNSEILERELTKSILFSPFKQREIGHHPHRRGLFGFLVNAGSKAFEDATIHLHTLLSSYAIFTPATPVLRGIQPDPVPLDPLGLLGGRLAEAIEDILDLKNRRFGRLGLDEVLNLLGWPEGFDITAPSRELLSPNVPSLRSVVRFKDQRMQEKRSRLSGYDADEGSLHILFILLSALHPRTPPFFAIDNFGHAISPQTVKRLTRQFCRLMLESEPPRQVLLTTHNPMVLDGLNLSDERIRLFVAERSDADIGTKVSRVRFSDKISEFEEKGISLSMMWANGLLENSE